MRTSLLAWLAAVATKLRLVKSPERGASTAVFLACGGATDEQVTSHLSLLALLVQTHRKGRSNCRFPRLRPAAVRRVRR